MSAPQKPWEGPAGGLALGNTATVPPVSGPTPSYISSLPGTSTSNVTSVPPLPPRPQINQMTPHSMNVGYNSYGMGTVGPYGIGGMGSYGGYGMGSYGYGGYMGGVGGMGAPYGGFNRLGGPMDLESSLIQMAQESSRPAFESIGGVVQAVGSVAMMLDNTFLALTSSFRAILGVAANFGHLRSLFAQMWSSFAIFRSLNWLVRKLLVVLGIRTETEFKAWAEAVAQTQNGTATPEQRSRSSGWPVLMFFGVLAAAPYIILRLLRGVNGSMNERLSDPMTWSQPLRAVAQHSFTATSPQELSFQAEQVLTLAPQHLQRNLWNSGWLMASTDGRTAGLVPVNYIKVIRPSRPYDSKPQDTNTPSTSKDLDRIFEENKNRTDEL